MVHPASDRLRGYALTVLLQEIRRQRRVQQVQHRFGGPTQAHALGRDDDRPVDEDGVLLDRVQQSVVGQRRVV